MPRQATVVPKVCLGHLVTLLMLKSVIYASFQFIGCAFMTTDDAAFILKIIIKA